MLLFQRLMQQFLETQRSVMSAYLKAKEDGSRRDSTGLAEIPPSLEATDEHTDGTAHINEMGERHEPRADELVETGKFPEDRESIVARLLQVVSERTGYPQEMLGLDLDLEADLGIDSIKRVEVLGQFVKMIFPAEAGAPKELMEDIKNIKTLRHIIDHIPTRKCRTEKKEDPSPDVPHDHTVRDTQTVPAVETDFPRFTVGPVPIPPPSPMGNLIPNKVVLIFDDGRGVGKALIDRLRHKGQPVAVICWQDGLTEVGEHVHPLTEISESEVIRVIQSIRDRQGPIGGIIHLFPLKRLTPQEEMDWSDWKLRLETEVKSLFLSLRAVHQDMQKAAAEGRAFVLAATAMGGTFGMHAKESPMEFFPGQGGIHGFLKTVALEWPEVRVKALDLSLDEPPRDLADCIMEELQAKDPFVEVGRVKSHRFSVGVTAAPLPLYPKNELKIDPSWVILATGGARGITAEVVKDLAKKHSHTLILAGKSDLSLKEEAPDTVHLTNTAQLKRAIISRMKSQGKTIRLTDVEAAYQQLQKDREIRENLAALRQLGSQVEYVQVDVRDAEDFGKGIDKIYQKYGRLDGVIHGAGIIEDKLLQDKSYNSFDRVFATKANSAYTLSKTLQPESLRFLALFSSVAGRFGNVGQCDYTAANEVMNKLALYLDQRWDARVFSINWGPWSGPGMASAEVQRQFTEKGVPLVHPGRGAAAFDRELRKGSKGEVEVILGDGPWKKDRLPQSRPIETVLSLPLLHGCQTVLREDDSWEIVKRLDPSNDIYLLDHRLDGKPVLPAAMAIEMMAEAASQKMPGWQVTGIHDVRVLKGIVLEEDVAEIQIVGRPRQGATRDRLMEVFETSIQKIGQPEIKYYSATTILRNSLPSSPPHAPLPELDGVPFWTSAKGAYENWLFHGPKFQCIEKIEEISEEGMVATLRPSSLRNFLGVQPDGNWLMDPVIVDGGLQLALLWARNYLDITVLPSHFEHILLFGSLQQASAIRCHFQPLEQFGGQSIRSNLFFSDPHGSLICRIEGFEATGSTALNRLGGSHLL
jgi:NAD(P)-dependent dehydrogenase (short-subunit alcohol dehydrogenase family)